MSIAAFAVGEAALGELPTRRTKANTTPVRRQYVVKSDVAVLPEAR